MKLRLKIDFIKDFYQGYPPKNLSRTMVPTMIYEEGRRGAPWLNGRLPLWNGTLQNSPHLMVGFHETLYRILIFQPKEHTTNFTMGRSAHYSLWWLMTFKPTTQWKQGFINILPNKRTGVESNRE